jgi:hypothetical protein
MATVDRQTTINFLVPAYGATDVITAPLPDTGNLVGAGGLMYGIDFKSLAATLTDTLFIPQACTVDTTSLTPGTSVEFTIPAIGFTFTIAAGIQKTFQFPALPDLAVMFVPSSGTPSFKTYWYNYPALPDGSQVEAVIAGAVAISSLPPVTIVTPPSGLGTEDSENSAGLAAHLLKTIPANTVRKGFVVQNQDNTAPLQVVLSAAGGTPAADGTIIILNPAGAAGEAGGSIDFSGIPHAGDIQIYSSNATAPFAARDW